MTAVRDVQTIAQLQAINDGHFGDQVWVWDAKKVYTACPHGTENSVSGHSCGWVAGDGSDPYAGAVAATKVWRQKSDGSAPEGAYLSLSLDKYCAPGVTDYAANSNGFTAALNALAAVGGGELRIPEGSWSFDVGTPITCTNWNNIRIVGSNRRVSELCFVCTTEPPTHHNARFIAPDNGAGMVSHFSIERVSLVILGAGHGTIAIDLRDVSECAVHDVTIRGWTSRRDLYPTRDPSVGIRIRGRELTTISKVKIEADIPLQTATNPNLAGGSADHFHFHDCTLASLDEDYELIDIPANCGISQCEFDGRQSWLGGAGGAKIRARCGVTFKNVRWESSGQTQSAPMFDIDPGAEAAGIQERYTFYDCHGFAAMYKLRNISGAVIHSSRYQGILGQYSSNAVDSDATVQSLRWNDLQLSGGVIALSGVGYAHHGELLLAGTYLYPTDAYVKPYLHIANGATVVIDTNTLVTPYLAILDVVARAYEIDATSAIARLSVFPDIITYIGAGDIYNVATSDTPLKLCFYYSGTDIVCKNNTGRGMDVLLRWN